MSEIHKFPITDYRRVILGQAQTVVARLTERAPAFEVLREVRRLEKLLEKTRGVQEAEHREAQ